MAHSEIPKNISAIIRIFEKRGIRSDQPAFYNQMQFIAAEQADPSFLEFYAAFVRLRPRDTAYDERVRSVVPNIVAVLVEEISKDSQRGVCIDASMMLMKMLEEQGVWSYAINGALTISSPDLPSPTYFWPMDIEPVAGHVWLAAPPFEIIDVSLSLQPYSRGEEKLLPPYLIAETGSQVVCAETDYCSSEVLRRARRRFGPVSNLHLKLDNTLQRRLNFFPSYELSVGTTKLRYCSGGVSVSDAPNLHAITSRRWNGKLAGELYDDVILPALALKNI